MPRPKQNTNELSAYERIITAFWDMLEEMPYAKITISGLSGRAGVNHNLIYYYFNNVDDLAMKAFQKNMADSEPQKLLSDFLYDGQKVKKVASDPIQLRRISRLRLFMRDDSSYLNKIVKDAIIFEWLKSAGKTREMLNADEIIDLEFIISGLIGILGSKENQEGLLTYAKIPERPLGKGIAATLRNIKDNSD